MELGSEYGEWEIGWRAEARKRRAEEERKWFVSNKWLTITTIPSRFSKSVDLKGFKFFRKNTCRSVDSAWFIGALNLNKSNT